MNNVSQHEINLTVILRRILLAAGFLAFLHVEYYNLKYIFDRELKAGYIFHNKNFLVFSVIMIFLAIAGFLLTDFIVGSSRITSTGYIFVLALLSSGLRLAFIFLFDSSPISDFQLLYRGAEEVVKGNYDFVKKAEYFLSWVYQIGFVAYQALIVKIFGQGYLALKVLNVVYSTGICIMVYLTGRRVFNENAGRIAGLAYCLYPSGIYMCAVLTNQILSAFLFYLAMYLAADKLKKYSFALLGLFTALGNIIRPEGPLILITISTFILLFKKNEITREHIWHMQDHLSYIHDKTHNGKDRTGSGKGRDHTGDHEEHTDHTQEHSSKSAFKSFIRALPGKAGVIAGTIMVFLVVTKIFDFILISSEISDFPLSNRDPLWKFVVGLNYEGRGLYNPEDFAYISRFPLGEERNREEIKIIKERTEDKKKLLKLFQAKMRILWSDFDHALTCYVVPGTDLTPFKTNVLLYLEKCYYTAITLFILISLGFLYFNTNLYRNHILYLMLILGFMFIHLFIEIQLRYRYLVMPAFFILGGFGIYSVSQQLKNHFITGRMPEPEQDK